MVAMDKSIQNHTMEVIMTDTITKEQLAGEVKAFEAELVDANKAHADAVSAMERARGDKSVSMEALVELADGIRAAKASSDRKAASIAVINRRIANFDVLAKAGERDAAMKGLHDYVAARFDDRAVGSLRSMGVDRVTVMVDIKEALLVNVKPTGEKLTGSTRAPSGNGRGFSSAGKVTVGGEEYASLNRAYVALRAAADGIDPGDVTPANSKSAEAWLTKNGHAISA